MNIDPEEKKTVLFTQLILSFQSAALQHLGKIADGVEGKIVRNLQQAAWTIDMLDMLNEKCKGSMTQDEERFLSHVLSELKLNYVDEMNREQKDRDEDKESKHTEKDTPDHSETEGTASKNADTDQVSQPKTPNPAEPEPGGSD